MKQRIITGVVAGAGFLGIIILGGHFFAGLIFLMATVAMNELLAMKQIRAMTARGFAGFFLMWLLVIPDAYINFEAFAFERAEFFLLILIVLLALTVVSRNKWTFDDAGFTVLASVYVGFGFYYFHYARTVEEGLMHVILILILVWSTDSGAYFAGRKFGKHKLSPSISPKKTIEGSLGGVVLALITGTIFLLFIPLFDSWIVSLLFMLTVSLVGQLGDLVESAFKRHYAVKDSGNVLPGHGGILDRFDSLIFVMPIIYLLGFI